MRVLGMGVGGVGRMLDCLVNKSFERGVFV